MFTVIKTVGDVEQAIANKITEAVKNAKAAMNTWISEQEARNTKAISDFASKIDTCHTAEITRMEGCGAWVHILYILIIINLILYKFRTAAETAARKLEQATEKTGLIEKFTEKQAANYGIAKQAYTDAINKYETNLNKCKTSIVDAFGACLTKKAKCVTDYENKLTTRIADMRTALLKNLKEVCYRKFMENLVILIIL